MITTDSDELAARLRVLRHQGISSRTLERHRSSRLKKVEFPVVGYNYRITDIQSAIGPEQMGRMDRILERREWVAGRYREHLGSDPHLQLPVVPEYARHNYQSYVAKLANGTVADRDRLVQFLLDNGIGASAGIGCIHREKPYKDLARMPLPRSEEASDLTFLLPLYPQMNESQVEAVAKAVLRR